MFKKQLLMIVFTLCALMSYAQVEIKGLVYDEYLEPFYNAKVTLNGKATTSNQEGEFTLSLSQKLPVTLRVSAFGYQDEEILITSIDKSIRVILKESFLLDQIVISASRAPERIIESPVTIERLGLNDIKTTSSNSFYDGLANLKGIQSREGSYGFKSINTRGFSDFSNSRFVQMVDGMDTTAPALNFSPGNLTGVSDLDIHSVEVLPGASSALYGANAYNGMMLMNTKNPFDFTGISFLLKSGYTSQKLAGNNNIYDVSIRMAYKFSESFAAKVNFSYFEAEEWHTNDTRNKQIDSNEIIEGEVDSPLNYDGVNVYGDEFNNSISIVNIGQRFFNVNLPQDAQVSRTGYSEIQLLDDYKSKNLKFDASFHIRPFEDESLELILSSRLARGNGIFQAASRYAQRDYYINQSKFEIKGDNFYVRSYYTVNDAGNSFDLNRTGTVLTATSSANNTVGSWGVDYLIGLDDNGVDFNNITADSDILRKAREYADSFGLQPGTPEFNSELNRIKQTLITEGGSKIYDKSSYKHFEGNYNFSSLLNDWGDVQIGGSFREYNPDSKGTIFNDGEKEIEVEEFGFYTQIQKRFLEDRLKLTGSVRYDKSENFEGNYSPRFAVNYALGDEKNHFLRASYQTGFRNPTIQEQYVYNQPGRKINLGTSRDNLDRVSIEGSVVHIDASTGVPTTYPGTITGDDIINNSLLTQTTFGDTGNPVTRVKSIYKEVMPEQVQTFELGYRSMFGITQTNNVNIDINGFYSFHKDFLFRQDVVTPGVGLVYPFGDRKLTAAELADPIIQQGTITDDVLVLDYLATQSIYGNTNNSSNFNRESFITTNSKSEVNSYGFGIALNTKILKSFDFGVNYNFIDFEVIDKDLGFFEPNFNTPKHTVKVQLGSNSLFKNFGFNINARWQDKYRWVSQFAKANIGSRTVLDAQLSYSIPVMKSKFKIGGTNLFGKEYFVAPGSGQIGQLYYISWVINN